MAAAGSFTTLRPGCLDYGTALALQERLLAERSAGGADVLLLLEHPATVTLGRSATAGQLRLPRATLQRQGIAVLEANRGGGATFHGPGQLVGYPIVDLQPFGRDLHRYLRLLEDVLLEVLATLGVSGTRRPGRTGIWVGNDKIAAIGVAVRHWIAWHGFALNLSADLAGFASIVPCGIEDAGVTSVERLTGRAFAREEIEELVIAAFALIFNRRHAGTYAYPNAA
jgi:lipoate-protein ligase B